MDMSDAEHKAESDAEHMDVSNALNMIE